MIHRIIAWYEIPDQCKVRHVFVRIVPTYLAAVLLFALLAAIWPPFMKAIAAMCAAGLIAFIVVGFLGGVVTMNNGPGEGMGWDILGYILIVCLVLVVLCVVSFPAAFLSILFGAK